MLHPYCVAKFPSFRDNRGHKWYRSNRPSAPLYRPARGNMRLSVSISMFDGPFTMRHLLRDAAGLVFPIAIVWLIVLAFAARIEDSLITACRFRESVPVGHPNSSDLGRARHLSPLAAMGVPGQLRFALTERMRVKATKEVLAASHCQGVKQHERPHK